MFLQECESASNNECASEKCCRQPEAYPSKLLELPRSHTADQDTTTTPGEDWTVPPYFSPTPQCEPLKAGNATVNQPNLDASAAPDFTPLASEFVGAMTQALWSSVTQGIGDSGGNTDMKHLAARQSSVNTKLPIFSGKAEEWPSFINLYRNTTQQCGFTDGENVQRLQAALKGPAKDAVQLILAVPENVEEAIRTLERRFGRPELVVEELIAKVRSLRTVKADDNEALLTLTTAINNVVTTMKLMKCPGHMLNPSLRREVVEKLPSNLRHQWGEHLNSTGLQGDSLGLDQFAEWLSARADAASLVSTIKPAVKSQSTFHAARTQPPKVTCCQRCQGNHSIAACSKFKALSGAVFVLSGRRPLEVRLPSLRLCKVPCSTSRAASIKTMIDSNTQRRETETIKAEQPPTVLPPTNSRRQSKQPLTLPTLRQERCQTQQQRSMSARNQLCCS